MTRLLMVLSAILAAAVAVAAQQPTFRAGTQSVPVYATVLDQTGRPILDLTQDDFEVFDNGVRQPLTAFTNDQQPISIVVMLDRSGSMEPNFRLERDAAEQFVNNLLPADRARLGSFSGRIQIDPPEFTTDREQLVGILREKLLDAGPTPLWNATAAAMTALAQEAGRRVVLLFTDGGDSPWQTVVNASASDIRERAQAEEIMVYAIGLADLCGRTEPARSTSPPPALPRFQGRGPGGPFGGFGIGLGPDGQGRPRPPRGPVGGGPRPPFGPGVPGVGIPEGPFGRRIPESGGTAEEEDRRPCVASHPDPELKTIADQSGGGYFELHGTEDLSQTFVRVAEELHHQYLMAFPAAVLDGKVHTIDVRVRRPSVTTRARRSYIAD